MMESDRWEETEGRWDEMSARQLDGKQQRKGEREKKNTERME
jgi:hypothetical protein